MLESQNGTLQCVLADFYSAVFLGILSFIQIVINGFPLLSLCLYGSGMSELNSIYVLVKNTLTVNLMSACLLLYSTVEGSNPEPHQGGHRYNQSDGGHTSTMQWWAFRRSFLMCLVVLMSVNVAGIMYRLKRRIFVSLKVKFNDSLSRSVSLNQKRLSGNIQTSGKKVMSDLSKSKSEKFRLSPKTLKKCKVYFFVILTWLIVMITSLLSGVMWNCIHACRCLPGLYTTTNCFTAEPFSCSAFWEPTSFSFRLFIVIMWMITVMFILSVLIQSIHGFNRQQHTSPYVGTLNWQEIPSVPVKLQPRESTLNSAGMSYLQTSSAICTVQLQRTLSEANILDTRVPETTESTSVRKTGSLAELNKPGATTNPGQISRPTLRQTSRQMSRQISNHLLQSTVKRSLSLPDLISIIPQEKPQRDKRAVSVFSPSAPKFSPSLKLATSLSLTLILSTAPIIIVYLADIQTTSLNLSRYDVETILFTTVSMYNIASPIFLVKYLAGAKKAVTKLLLKLDVHRK